MLAKIFVLIVIGLGSDGTTMTYQAGTFEAPQLCTEAAQKMMVDLAKRNIPKDRAMLACIETPWVVKGQRGA